MMVILCLKFLGSLGIAVVRRQMWDKMAVCLTATTKYGDAPRQFPMNLSFSIGVMEQHAARFTR